MSPPGAHRRPGGTGRRADDLHGGGIAPQRSALVLDLAAIDAASEGDRIYFEQHPDERERVRLAVPGEMGSSVAWVQVVQVARGIRVRMAWMVNR